MIKDLMHRFDVPEVSSCHWREVLIIAYSFQENMCQEIWCCQVLSYLNVLTVCFHKVFKLNFYKQPSYLKNMCWTLRKTNLAPLWGISYTFRTVVLNAIYFNIKKFSRSIWSVWLLWLFILIYYFLYYFLKWNRCFTGWSMH